MAAPPWGSTCLSSCLQRPLSRHGAHQISMPGEQTPHGPPGRHRLQQSCFTRPFWPHMSLVSLPAMALLQATGPLQGPGLPATNRFPAEQTVTESCCFAASFRKALPFHAFAGRGFSCAHCLQSYRAVLLLTILLRGVSPPTLKAALHSGRQFEVPEVDCAASCSPANSPALQHHSTPLAGAPTDHGHHRAVALE